MKHVGDITRINGAEITPVWCITGGSPCQDLRFERMAAYLPEGATLGSLFDGIGGFPLCWESIHGKGTAVWASEIEPFAIAVTKHHFGGDIR